MMDRWIVLLTEIFANRFVMLLIIFIQPAMFGWASGGYYRGRNMFFGVRVGAAFVDSPCARAIVRKFRIHVWIWSAVVTAIYALGDGVWAAWFSEDSTWWFVGCLMVNLAGSMVAFAWASKRTRREAAPLPAAPVRIANVFATQEQSSVGLAIIEWAGMLLPVGLPVATMILIVTAPAAFPWQNLTGLAGICMIGALPALTQFALRFRARSSDWASDPVVSRKRRALLGALQSSVFVLMILQFCALTLMQFHVAVPFNDMNGYFRFSFPAQFLLLLFVVLLRRSLSKAFRREGGDTMPDDCWKWGSFYFNRNDPALVVPLRFGMGYSFNYAHRTTRILMTLTACALVLLFVHIP
jgi:uncharacterized membrane protein